MVSPTLDGRPEFSWRIESNENNLLQKAYRIKVSREGKVCFDSGRVESNLQSFIEYGGEELLSRSRYDVQVTAWDNFGNIATGESYKAKASCENGIESVRKNAPEAEIEE